MKFLGFMGTKQKKNVLYDTVVYINLLKNAMSIEVSNNLEKYFQIPNEEKLRYESISYISFERIMIPFVNERNTKQIKISDFYKEAIKDVYKDYDKKVSDVREVLRFYIPKCQYVLYKKKTETNNPGDLKEVKVTRKYSLLCTTLTYFARWGSEYTPEYIDKQLSNNKLPKDKKNFFEQVKRHIEKFSFERLYNLALRKRERIFKEYFKDPIFYSKATLRGRCRRENILIKNEKSSIIDAWIVLSGYDSYKTLYYPVKYSKKYHGDIDDYNQKHVNHEYIIKFDEVTKNPIFILQKSGKRKEVIIGQEVDESRLASFDVNIKHNLLMSDKGKSYNLPKKNKDELIAEYIKEVYKTYDLQRKNKFYTIGKKRRKKLDTLTRKIVSLQRDLIADICKELSEEGKNHIILEDLKGTFGKCFIKRNMKHLLELTLEEKNLTEEEINIIKESEEFKELTRNINLALVTKFLHISSIKDEFIHIAKNYGIAVSLVQCADTSQGCSRCGHISKENRKTQEIFKCRCGHEMNADHNAAINILNRVSNAVLREALLKQNPETGVFRPSPGKESKETVRKILVSVRYEAYGDVSSESQASPG